MVEEEETAIVVEDPDAEVEDPVDEEPITLILEAHQRKDCVPHSAAMYLIMGRKGLRTK